MATRKAPAKPATKPARKRRPTCPEPGCRRLAGHPEGEHSVRKPPTGRPPGRPSSMDHVCGLDPETGQPETVEARLVRMMADGHYLETAAAASGVHRFTVHGWLKVGAAAYRRTTLPNAPQLTPHEARCITFSAAVDQARAEALARDWATLGELAHGGRTATTKTTKTNAAGEVVETTTKVETLLPDAATLRWRLERRHPDLFGPTSRVDARIDTAAGEPDPDAAPPETPEERAARILGSLLSFRGDADGPTTQET